MHQFVFSISSWFCLGRLYTEDFVHFFPCSSILLAFVIYYDPLHFCGVSCNFSFSISDFMDLGLIFFFLMSAAAAAKSLQLCPTLCDPIDGSPPGSPVPGILQLPFPSPLDESSWRFISFVYLFKALPWILKTNTVFFRVIRFTEKLSVKVQRLFTCLLPPHMHRLPLLTSPTRVHVVTMEEPTRTHNHHPESTVYSRVHS